MKNIARIYLRLWKVIRGAKKGGDLLAEVGKREFRNTPAPLVWQRAELQEILF